MSAARRVAILGLLGAILVVAQVSLSFLPNIELVSLLLVVMTLCIGKYVWAPLLVFILVEALIYGMSMWVVNYLYVWPLLCSVAYLLRRQRAPLFWALVNGAFGLCFGALCALPYLLIGGHSSAFAYWVSGLYFDLLHCAGNFGVALLLFKPLLQLAERLLHGFGQAGDVKNL